MNNSWNHLQEARRRLAALQKIRKDMDPASGVTFLVRRGGGARDNEDVAVDETVQPWTAVEVIDMPMLNLAMDTLIQSQNESIEYWTICTKRDIRDATKILEEGNQ